MNKAQMLTQLYPSRPAAEMDGIVADLVTAGADVLYGVQLQKSNGIVRSEVGLSFCRSVVFVAFWFVLHRLTLTHPFPPRPAPWTNSRPFAPRPFG
jgi:hypothetical protein